MPGLISRCGGGACGGLIDSTETAGDTCGVHSVGATGGWVLAADGSGGSLWQAGGGYTPPTAGEGVLVGPTVITAGFQQPVALSHGNGAHLLGYANPLQPTIVTAGIYAFSFTMSGVAVVPAGTLIKFAIGLSTATPPGGTVSAAWTSPTGGTIPAFSVSTTHYMAAGDSFFVTVANLSAANLTFQDISPLSFVQRIT